MQKYIPAFLLVALGISARLFPHPANFAPIAAIAIFSGIYLPKKLTLIIPLGAMFISDLVLGFYLLPVMISVYIAFAITGIIGLTIRKNKKFSAILGGTLLASILFFIITNWAVWAFGTMYAHNLNGLLQSYVAALPFFRNTVLGDLFYTAVLVGSMEAIIFIQTKNNRAAVLE